jgi:hypothetical protein
VLALEVFEFAVGLLALILGVSALEVLALELLVLVLEVLALELALELFVFEVLVVGPGIYAGVGVGT